MRQVGGVGTVLNDISMLLQAWWASLVQLLAPFHMDQLCPAMNIVRSLHRRATASRPHCLCGAGAFPLSEKIKCTSHLGALHQRAPRRAVQVRQSVIEGATIAGVHYPPARGNRTIHVAPGGKD